MWPVSTKQNKVYALSKHIWVTQVLLTCYLLMIPFAGLELEGALIWQGRAKGYISLVWVDMVFSDRVAGSRQDWKEHLVWTPSSALVRNKREK